MPEVVVRVFHVEPTQIDGGLTRYTVTCYDDAKNWQFQTLNPWHASLCKQAERMARLVKILWKDGSPKRWGGSFPKVIVDARMEKDACLASPTANSNC